MFVKLCFQVRVITQATKLVKILTLFTEVNRKICLLSSICERNSSPTPLAEIITGQRFKQWQFLTVVLNICGRVETVLESFIPVCACSTVQRTEACVNVMELLNQLETSTSTPWTVTRYNRCIWPVTCSYSYTPARYSFT